MRIKHWQGYGTLNATKVKDDSCKLHIRVEGDHEWGLVRDDEYDLFYWLVKKFDKDVENYLEWHKMEPRYEIETNPYGTACDYKFYY